VAGFDGITIDRMGFPDQAAGLEARLARLLGVRPLVSGNGRLSFLSMADYNRRTRWRYSPEELAEILTPVYAMWQEGFAEQEGTPANHWRWGASEGELVLYNPRPRPRKVTLQMLFGTGYEEPSRLQIEGDLLSADLTVSSAGTSFSRTLTVPPGQHKIKFTCSARRLESPGDTRMLVFRIINFSLEEVDGPGFDTRTAARSPEKERLPR
jgi:hypothetical protein